eukprot:TRINITY_DN5633_c0_g1_i1.p1 TRINITY_DN5633_c0_g1~~TRINITY_DN5633_c0_g1_i1.p1  ORF type:complete len:623 (+),score=82.37 TRINITY_DN5633_c0_g1_i1:332-2200(+)
MKVLSPSHLNHLLQLCSTTRALKQGKQVHQQIILNGFASNVHLKTKLVQMYADCDDFTTACLLFSELPRPNVFAWTTILSLYERSGKYRECLKLYREMKAHGITPDGYVFPRVLKSCTRLLNLEEGIQVHNDVIRFGVEPNLHVSNSLIDMYSKCGDIENARRVFDNMAERDMLSWNSIISGYVSNGLLLDAALEVLNSMKLAGFEPDLITWNTIMDAYSQMGLYEEAIKFFYQIAHPNIISWTTLILAYSRSGKHAKALCIFRDMVSGGVISLDLDILSSVLSSCRHLEALRYGQELHGFGLKAWSMAELYESIGAVLVTLYAVCKRIQDAAYVFKMMDKHSVVTWNAMILGFAHLRMAESAISYFCDMQLRGVKYDEVTISAILPVCGLNFGKQIHAHVRRTHFVLPILVWNALINMYSKSGCIGLAYSLFLSMGARDVVSWNTMIGGYGMHGHGRAALELLQQMRQSATQPNSVTFTSVLSACSHSGLVDEGLNLFNILNRDFNFEPTMEHYACVVDLLARAGRFAETIDFIKKMSINPDGTVWGSLLAACRVHQNINFGRLAAENLFRIEPGNPGNYVTLSNIYARAGRWDDAKRVRKLMESRGLIKPSGYSWVEAKK